MPKQPIQGQESLLVVSEQTGQIYAPPILETDGLAVDRVEQKLHLMNTLSQWAGARMREGLVRHGPDGNIQDRYGDEATTVVLGAERKRVELINMADDSFKRATGYYALLDSGLFDARKVNREQRTMYSDFLKQFTLRGKEKVNADYRKQLSREVTELSSQPRLEQDVSQFNRAAGVRPHNPPIGDLMDTIPVRELPKLGRPDRLEAILLDPRAGFLPKQTHDLNRVISWLDYLDNPQKELGIINQLREVFVRSEWPTRKSKPEAKGPRYGVRYGVRAIESIAWEVGDSLEEALLRQRGFETLSNALDQDQRPTLTLAEGLFDGDVDSLEKLGDFRHALASMVQFADLKEFMETGEVQGLSLSPLRASEDPPASQRPKFSAEPGKRKTIYNQYTRQDVKPAYEAHIVEKLRGMTIKQARTLLAEAKVDTVRELAFMSCRFAELHTFDSGPTKPLENALETIDSRISRLLAVA